MEIQNWENDSFQQEKIDQEIFNQVSKSINYDNFEKLIIKNSHYKIKNFIQSFSKNEKYYKFLFKTRLIRYFTIISRSKRLNKYFRKIDLDKNISQFLKLRLMKNFQFICNDENNFFDIIKNISFIDLYYILKDSYYNIEYLDPNRVNFKIPLNEIFYLINNIRKSKKSINQGSVEYFQNIFCILKNFDNLNKVSFFISKKKLSGLLFKLQCNNMTNGYFLTDKGYNFMSFFANKYYKSFIEISDSVENKYLKDLPENICNLHEVYFDILLWKIKNNHQN